jgi:hypothetical protein
VLKSAVKPMPSAMFPPCQSAELAQLPPPGLIHVPFWEGAAVPAVTRRSIELLAVSLTSDATTEGWHANAELKGAETCAAAADAAVGVLNQRELARWNPRAVEVDIERHGISSAVGLQAGRRHGSQESDRTAGESEFQGGAGAGAQGQVRHGHGARVNARDAERSAVGHTEGAAAR